MAVVALPVLWRRRLERWRAVRVFQHEFVLGRHYFDVPEMTERQCEASGTMRVDQRSRELRVFGGHLYRSVLNPNGHPAALVNLSEATFQQLLEGAARPEVATFWGDHPSSIARAHWAPEEPYFAAEVAFDATPRFWRLDMDDEEHACQRLQAALDRFVLFKGRLWRPTSAPGWKVRAAGNRAEPWMHGVGIDSVTASYYDFGEHESALRRTGDADMDRVVRIVDLARSFGQVPPVAQNGADLHTTRLCLQLISTQSRPTIAAYGPVLAELYWAGRRILSAGGTAAACTWLNDLTIALDRHADPKLVKLGALLGERAASRFDFSNVR